MKKILLTTGLAAGMLLTGLASPAFADPTDGLATLNGGGSDTTEVVMKALDATSPALGSWNITGGAWDTNGTATGCSFTGRLAGSGDGRKALANSVSNGDGCFQFARSSSRATSEAPADLAALPYSGTGTTPVQMLPITLGVDGLTYVFRAGSATPRDLTLGQLRAIYSCTFTGTVDGRNMSFASIPNQPLLPTDASGSRADWMALMQLTAKADVASDGGTLPGCIEDGPGDTGQAGGEFSEHNGNVLSNGRQIILHSTGQYIAQGRANAGDFRGLSQLGYINGNTPMQAYDNPAGTLATTTANGSAIADGAFFRNVYNLVPASKVSDADIVAVFGNRSGGSLATGSDTPEPNSGAICQQDALIISNGFIPVC